MTKFASLLAAAILLRAGLAVAPAAAADTKIIFGTGIDPSLAQTYVAVAGGFFKKNGLDVELKPGASAAVWVPLLIGNQVQAAIASEQTGVLNAAIDPRIVNAGQAVAINRFFGIVGRNVGSLDELKGKRIAVDLGSASQTFWLALVKFYNLDVKDYKVISVQPPEMEAALQRGDVDAFVAWEPWVTRAITDVPNTKLLRDNDGILSIADYFYFNRSWAEANKDTVTAFMRSMLQATDWMHAHPEEAAQITATYLKLDPKFTQTLMTKVNFDIELTAVQVAHVQAIAAQLKGAGKLNKDIDWSIFFYPEALRSVAPEKVTIP